VSLNPVQFGKTVIDQFGRYLQCVGISATLSSKGAYDEQRAELDAYYARLYGLSRDELRAYGVCSIRRRCMARISLGEGRCLGC
jgi:hypothetical protein